MVLLMVRIKRIEGIEGTAKPLVFSPFKTTCAALVYVRVCMCVCVCVCVFCTIVLRVWLLMCVLFATLSISISISSPRRPPAIGFRVLWFRVLRFRVQGVSAWHSALHLSQASASVLNKHYSIGWFGLALAVGTVFERKPIQIRLVSFS